jgi:hypothetical protein
MGEPQTFGQIFKEISFANSAGGLNQTARA